MGKGEAGRRHNRVQYSQTRLSPGQVPCASLGSYGNMAIPANLAFVGFNLQQSKSRGAAMKMDKVAGSGNDEFYTPEYAIAPLYKYLPPPP